MPPVAGQVEWDLLRRISAEMPPHVHGSADPHGIRYECACLPGSLAKLGLTLKGVPAKEGSSRDGCPGPFQLRQPERPHGEWEALWETARDFRLLTPEIRRARGWIT
jgi:hypothetical protein